MRREGLERTKKIPFCPGLINFAVMKWHSTILAAMKVICSRRILSFYAVTMGCLVAGTSLAAIFPDVPSEFIYQKEIEYLVGEQVINGNPDGRFYPDRQVNRAEMLKLLYRAAGRMPEGNRRLCFTDVQPGSWYESYVCDAAFNHIVEGYNDGFFRPERPVTRVEALKMIAEVFHLTVENLTQETRDIVKFVDVSLSAWYTKYLYLAFSRGILPIAGQGSPRFYPDAPLLRGEAAAYIYNVLRQQGRLPLDTTTTDVVDEDEGLQGSSVSSSSSEVQESTARVRERKEGGGDESFPASPKTQDINVPFDGGGTFDGKKPAIFKMVLTRDSMITVLATAKTGDVSCRLYRLEDGGFSNEYYLGVESEGGCHVRAALAQGDYQLEVRPTSADARYTLALQETVGDGNDGFMEARGLVRRIPRTAVLEGEDLMDWYRFVVKEDTDMFVRFTTDGGESKCMIYPMGDVDLYGFNGPECNILYKYTPGTYYIGVLRTKWDGNKESYTIQLE
ncbi:hypothetical protein COW95_02860 [Candidatus Peregrinibacteria bacterium CG22_combo_CG10-13_8_21_14_all_49_11]|nr:MAG: hypothetical protein COW95_02860 [Candidatus Peregrinibacteria bacterium CG22_combo_CG10-13_8_21_14_all_49_11]